MILLYRVIAYLVYFAAYLFGRGKVATDDLWAGRLAARPLAQADLWFHAASVGEVRVISYLMAHVRHRNPKLTMHLTVMTRSGYVAANSGCGSMSTVSYMPLDVPLLWRRVIRQLAPRLVVVAETEIWPNLIISLRRAGVPLVLVNGRLSDRAFDRYRILRASFQPLLSGYDHLFVKGRVDFERFSALGVPEGRMTLAGDMKFDAPLVESTAAQRCELRRSLGVSDGDFLLVAGSTRPGEESQLLRVVAQVSGQFPRLRLVLVPRHVDRVPEVIEIARNAGFVGKIAFTDTIESENTVLIVDKMGVLIELYSVADLAFVGGTLTDVGGHNLLEPVWAGTPVVFGPSIANVRDAAEYITEHRFGTMATTLEELTSVLERHLEERAETVRKTQSDLEHSAAAAAGNYILERIGSV